MTITRAFIWVTSWPSLSLIVSSSTPFSTFTSLILKHICQPGTSFFVWLLSFLVFFQDLLYRLNISVNSRFCESRRSHDETNTFIWTRNNHNQVNKWLLHIINGQLTETYWTSAMLILLKVKYWNEVRDVFDDLKRIHY